MSPSAAWSAGTRLRTVAGVGTLARTVTTAGCVLLAAASVAPAAFAQDRRATGFASWEAPLGAPPAVETVHTGIHAAPADPVLLAVAGVAGNAAGVFGGGYLGYTLERSLADPCGEDCGLGGLLLGATVGSAVVTPLAVHLANRGRGNLGKSLFMSGLITGGGLALALATDSPVVLFAVPVATVAGAVATELATTPR